jgi:CRISPR-associated endonuclease Csn1
LILKRLKKINGLPENFLTKEREESLWQILYSVEDENDIVKALKTFAFKNGLDEDFVEQFKKFPRIEKEYGSYSFKAIKKLLPLMRMGKYWNEKDIIDNVPLYQQNIQYLINTLETKDVNITEEKRLEGKSINTKLLEKLYSFSHGNIDAYKGIEHFLSSYLVYGKHSEDSDVLFWKTPPDIDKYLKEFKQHSLRNPIVEQVILETLRVVKDVWKFYGNNEDNFFSEIHLELGREMKNPADKRKQITNQINENENTNLRVKALLAEMMNEGDVENVRPYSPIQQQILKIYEEGVLNAANGNTPDDILKISKQAVPTSSDLKRYKLWLDQGYHSPYTGKTIPLSKLFTREYDIEHIIPQSRYFDDSLSNKIICETEINNDKGNRTAYEYMMKEGAQ